MTPQEITLDLNPSFSRLKTVHCSQYDNNVRQITVKLQDGGTDVDVSTYTIYIEGTKPDKHGFSYALAGIGTVSGNTVTFYVQTQMCAVPGLTIAEVVLTNGTDRIGSANFNIAVERAGLAEDIDISETDIPAYVDGAQQAAEEAEQAKDDAVSAKETAVSAAETAQGVLESIPEDYSDLSNDVDDLKSALYEPSDNLLDYTQARINQLPNSWSGSTYNDFSTLNGWKTSNLIPVTEGKVYCVVENGALKHSYLVDFYNESGSYLQKVEMGADTTVTAPANAKYMYMFKNGTNPDFSSQNVAIKEYTADMDYVVRPYGATQKFLTSPYTYGIKKDGSTYYHFAQIGKSKYIIRRFTRFGVNNLLDLSAVYNGDVVDGELVISDSIQQITTDTIGPISIHRGSVDNYLGSWSGGVHGVTVSGTEYPTAEQTDLKVYCSGEEITEDGLYWGKAVIVATNDLYFPKSITGSDLSTAVKAIKEVRTYELTDVMTVKVALSFYTRTYISMYYGCQSTNVGMTTLRFPNNETVQNITRSASYIGTEKENTLIADNGTKHYAINVRPLGLGTFSKNLGTASDTGYCYISTYYKYYFVLIANELNQIRYGDVGTEMYWEAVYNYYID